MDGAGGAAHGARERQSSRVRDRDWHREAVNAGRALSCNSAAMMPDTKDVAHAVLGIMDARGEVMAAAGD